MTGERSHPQNPLLSQLQRAVQRAEQPEFWEAARVNYMLKTLQLGEHRHQLQLDNSGGLLTFEAVNARLGLPVVFCADAGGETPLHRQNKAVHPNWFKNFAKLPFAQVYFAQLSSYSLSGDTRPFALVFPRKGFSQGLCIHNGDPQRYVMAGAGVHLFRSRTGDCMVQPFRDVLAILKADRNES